MDNLAEKILEMNSKFAYLEARRAQNLKTLNKRLQEIRSKKQEKQNGSPRSSITDL
jgi:hypothetical protein